MRITTVSGAREARKRFESALQLSPNYVPALIALANLYSEELQFGPNPDRKLVRAENGCVDRPSGQHRSRRRGRLECALGGVGLAWPVG